MSLIEYLEDTNWRAALRRSFEGAINLLQTDRHGRCSSAVDDVRSWLANGGVSRVKLQLDREMKRCRFSENHQIEILDFLEQLVQENQRPLMQLMADRIIPWNQADFLVTMGVSESDFDTMLQQILTGVNPLETWMLTNGYSQEVVDKIYEVIDSWLVRKGLRSPTTQKKEPS
ncbi:MAG: hypothetical protein KME64_35575 [Scytonematopsis contorta HA4267-MV1]|jgi:hypothetical protein|nr:hypothetical protein [Scytonematopsis contorta HA4267-MV1]